MKRITSGIILSCAFALVVQAQQIAPQDAISTDTVEQRHWYYTSQTSGWSTRPAAPADGSGSIRVNRAGGDTINFTPTDLVREIFLKAYHPEDKQRIQNVKHVGWNWNGTAWTANSVSITLNDDPYYSNGLWGYAGSNSTNMTAASTSYDPDERSLLYFSRGDAKPDSFELQKGLLLTTGGGLMAEGPNKSHHSMNGGFRSDGRWGAHKGGHDVIPTPGHVLVSPILNPNRLSLYASRITAGHNVTPNPLYLHGYRPQYGAVPFGMLGDGTKWDPRFSFDRDLDGLTGSIYSWSTCGAVLEFDFQPAISTATFDYIFASDEYPEGIYSVNDVFGFFVSGPFDAPPGSDDIEGQGSNWSLYDPTDSPPNVKEYRRVDRDGNITPNGEVYYRHNIALLPDGNPVGINYVNWGVMDYHFTKIYGTTYGNQIQPTWGGLHSGMGLGSGAAQKDEFYKDNPSQWVNPADWKDHTYFLPEVFKTNPNHIPTAPDAANLGYKNYNDNHTNPYNPTTMAPALLERYGNDGTLGIGNYYALPNNPHLFRYNYIDGRIMEYDGYTAKLTAKADRLIPGKWYRLKLAVSNTSQPEDYLYFDINHGSAVFLADLDLGVVGGSIDDPYNDDPAFDPQGKDDKGNKYLYAQEDDSKRAEQDPKEDYIVEFTIPLSDVLAIGDKVMLLEIKGIPGDAIYLMPEDTLFSKVFIYNEFYSNLYKGNFYAYTLSGVPADTLQQFTFRFTTDYPDFENGNYIQVIASLSINGARGKDSVIVNGPLYRHAEYRPVWSRPSTLYSGKIELNTTYGSPKLHFSVNGGLSWTLAAQPFKPWEIEAAFDQGYILMRDPRSGYKIDTLWAPPPTTPPGLIRTVVVPHIEGWLMDPAPGAHRIDSRTDFLLHIVPSSDFLRAAGETDITVSTDRRLVSDEQGVALHSFVDHAGSKYYVFTIFKVQEDTRISIVVPQVEGIEDTEASAPAVWAEGDRLHIRAAAAGQLAIYTLNGALYRTLALYAGDSTVATLPPGVYIVRANGKSYKVSITQ